MSIWESCQGRHYIKPLKAEPWRVVEAQHILSARDLVDSNHEHDILEGMLEDSKPLVDKQKGYLIFTPFRYPPLKYGSRFGDVFEPSLWYGSLSLTTAFAETAYYRRQFLNDSEAALGYIELTLTAFNVSVNTAFGVDLTSPPFDTYTADISHQNSYEHSQALGRSMREAEVNAFLFQSARAADNEKNLAAFTPNVFSMENGQYIREIQNWQCIANQAVVEFSRFGLAGYEKHVF